MRGKRIGGRIKRGDSEEKRREEGRLGLKEGREKKREF